MLYQTRIYSWWKINNRFGTVSIKIQRPTVRPVQMVRS